MLNDEQQKAYDAMCAGENVFLTGNAGTGKSFIIKKFIEEHKKRTVVCAPTGIVANNIGGVTLHRAFNIPASPCPAPGNRHVKIFQGADTVIIDEISMCRIDVFDYICGIIHNMEEKLDRKIQLIVCGDFCQLPPIITQTDREILVSKYGKGFNSGYPFQSDEWNKRQFKTFVLSETIRQGEDTEFVNILNDIRNGKKESVTNVLRACEGHVPSDDAITICGRNDEAERLNNQYLDRLNASERIFDAALEGKVSISDAGCLSKLRLKEGCRVISLINDENATVTNGSLGTITSINKNIFTGKTNIRVKWDDGHISVVEQYTWQIYTYKLVSGGRSGVSSVQQIKVGTITQYPLKPAYAITVHKSQGQQYDKVNIMLSNTFAYGQLYTAISRAKNISGLYINPDIKATMMADPVVLNFYKSFLQNKPKADDFAIKSRGKGRPSSWAGKETKLIRVPVDIAEQVLEYAHSLV